MADNRRPYLQFPLCERVDYYVPGLYHPVDIGDVFRGRYHVVHRLGAGGYATTWLVHDSVEERWLALKVVVDEISRSTSELSALLHLKGNREQSHHPGKDFVLDIIDHFEVEGPNGTHLCLVTELLGPSLEEGFPTCRNKDGKLPLALMKALATQVASGAAYLHSQGIVHGDLHLGNILFKIPGSTSEWSKEDIEFYFGEPVTAKIRRSDEKPLSFDDAVHLPKFTVQNYDPIKLLRLCIRSEAPVEIKIVDFGEAFFTDGQSTKAIVLGIPPLFAAPEVLLEEPVGRGADIWAMAALFHMFFRGFQTLFGHAEYARHRDDVLASIASYFGKFPEEHWNKWSNRHEHFDDSGNFVGSGVFSPGPLIRMDNLQPAHQLIVEELLKKMLEYQPEKRMSAESIMSFLKTWNVTETT